jgi:hypothetical protein
MKLIDDGKNKKYMDELKNRIKYVIPFLGAGASIPYGFPSWSKILEILYKITITSENVSEENQKNIQKNISNKHYMDAVDEMDYLLPNLSDVVCHEIERKHEENVITNCNKGLLGEYLHIFPSKTYMTTNYDMVAEKILRIHFQDNLQTEIPQAPDECIQYLCPKVQKKLSNLDLSRPTLYYLHGNFEDSNSIILSRNHYNNYYGYLDDNDKYNMRRPLAKKLFDLYYSSKRTFLFIGCSMSLKEDRILMLLKKMVQD